MSLLDALLMEEVELKAPAESEFELHVYEGKKRVAPFQRSAFFVAHRNDTLVGSGTPDDPWRGNTVLGPLNTGTVALASVLDVTIPTNQSGGRSIRFDSADSRVTVKLSCGSTAHQLVTDDPITIFDAAGETAFNKEAYASCPTYLDPGVANNQPFLPYDPNTEFLYSFSHSSLPGNVVGSFHCKRWVLTVSVDAGHGLQVGDAVQLSGVGGVAGTYLNRILSVRTVASTTFSCLIDHKLDDPNTPAITTGTAISWLKVTYGLDVALKKLPLHSVLFLGEGVFETRGDRGGTAHPGKPVAPLGDGQRIIGAGIDATTLRLIIAEPAMRWVNYGAIGPNGYENMVDGFECSDITVDCDMATHPVAAPYGTLVKRAVFVGGAHVRLRRIRAIDFGTQTPDAECFTIGSGGSHVNFGNRVGIDCLIDECITEFPSKNNTRETTCIGILGGGVPLVSRNRGSGVRNCVADSRDENGNPTMYNRLAAYSGPDNGLVTVTMRCPHHLDLSIHDVVRIANHLAQKTFKLHSIESDLAFKIEFAPGDSTTVFEPQSSVGVQYHGVGGDGTAAFVENNRVFHVWLGSNHDTGASEDVVHSKNYFRAVQEAARQYLAQYDVGQAIRERNVVELWPSLELNLHSQCNLVYNAYFITRRVAIRENYMRPWNDIPDEWSGACYMAGVHKAMVHGNVLDLVGAEVKPDPRYALINNANVYHPRSAGNYRVSGELVRGWDSLGNRFRDFASEIEDSLFVNS